MSAVVETQIRPFYETQRFTLFCGDCRSVLPTLDDCSVDSIVTDPPYFLTNENGNGFMGKAWDSLSLSNAIVDALFRSARLVLHTDAASTAPAPVNTTASESEINPTGNVLRADLSSTVARRTLNQNTTSAHEIVITKQEALALCDVLSPDHTIYLRSLPTSAVLVVSDLSTALSGKNIARRLAAILLDDPVWLEQIITFTSMDRTERSVTEASNGSSLGSKSTSAIDIPASDAESIVGRKRSNVTTSCHTTFQEITARIISSPSATRAIRLCTGDRSLIPVLSEVFHRRWSREALRVLKPGGHLLAFAGTRTYHRLVSALEDEGFEVRDQIQWIYASGFPKSLDISKAIDAAAGAEREVIGVETIRYDMRGNASSGKGISGPNRSREPFVRNVTGNPATDAAKQWNGWGTALKPAHEPIVLARKPLIGTVAENVLKHGTGGLNIDGCRIESEPWQRTDRTLSSGLGESAFVSESTYERRLGQLRENTLGRWPANVIHDGSDEVLAAFPETTSGSGIKNPVGGVSMWERGSNWRDSGAYEGDSGSAARFFYCAKADASDRNEGLNGLVLILIQWPKCGTNTTRAVNEVRLLVDTDRLPLRATVESGTQHKSVSAWSTSWFGSELTALYQTECKSITTTKTSSITASRILNSLIRYLTSVYMADVNYETESGGNPAESAESSSQFLLTTNAKTASALGVESAQSPARFKISVSDARNFHSTVKPTELMRYLCRLITPPGGLVLDPFCGSGSTGKAAMLEGFRFIGIELSTDYCELAQRRIDAVTKQGQLFL